MVQEVKEIVTRFPLGEDIGCYSVSLGVAVRLT